MTNNKLALAKLAKQMSGCKKCRHIPSDSHAVFAGKYGNKIMVIGQAPGKQELKYNKPFCGPAGKRLFQWLAQVNVLQQEFRAAAYFTQMMKCFPGSKDGGDLKPNRQQLNNCGSYLEKEFKLLKPKIVIPVGKLAIEKFLGEVKLDEVVGNKFTQEIYGQQVLIVPLPHPSGASPWCFKKDNQLRLAQAMKILKRYYVRLKS